MNAYTPGLHKAPHDATIGQRGLQGTCRREFDNRQFQISYLTMTVSKNRVNPESPASPGPTGRRYGGVDSEERQRQRKARLIEAGLAVFGEQGYHASTVRDVCGKAQLTSRYFYESFDSMEALFKAVYVTINRELMQHTVMALARCEPLPEKLAEAALRANPHLAEGLNVHAGKVTYKAVADELGYDYLPVSEAIA